MQTIQPTSKVGDPQQGLCTPSVYMPRNVPAKSLWAAVVVVIVYKYQSRVKKRPEKLTT